MIKSKIRTIEVILHANNSYRRSR